MENRKEIGEAIYLCIFSHIKQEIPPFCPSTDSWDDDPKGLLRGDRRSLHEECSDTKAGRQAPSLRWLTFHTYEEPQCPELKGRVMMSAQVPSDRREVRGKTKGQVRARE